MKKQMLALVAPYFGKLPAHFQLWLDSCSMNPQVTWLLYTDDRAPWIYPDNVMVTYCTLDDLRERFQKKFGFKISLPSVKKLGDYKPLYGYLFEEELKGYLAWGNIDVSDVIYGDFSKFITEDLILQYDRLGYLGHLTIYQNTPENNRRFMADSDAGFDYRAMLSSSSFYNFEEVAEGSIDAIWRHNGWTTRSLDDEVADLSSLSWAFRIAKGYAGERKRGKNRNLIFEWREGCLVGYQIEKDGGISSREYLYVHFKRRKMPVLGEVNPSHYLISPQGFSSAPDRVDVHLLRDLGKGKFPDPMWIDAKSKNLLARIKRCASRI